MFKVGDKVRIKKNLVVEKDYGEELFVEDMVKYEGKQAIVEHDLGNFYKLDIDKGEFNWTDNMLEAINHSDENTDEVSTNLVEIDQIKQFKKEDFRLGNIITVRNGIKYMYADKGMYGHEGEHLNLYNYTDDLKDTDGKTEHDIVKVERFIQTLDNKYDLKTLYERKKEILDEKEKEYLINLINPFRSRVEYIQKRRFSKESKFCWLNIGYQEKTDIRNREIYSAYMELPGFNKNAMYTGMAEEYKYTPEQLGL